MLKFDAHVVYAVNLANPVQQNSKFWNVDDRFFNKDVTATRLAFRLVEHDDQ